MKDESGRADFTRIMAEWKVETEKECSETLDGLREMGRAGTLARRDQGRHGERWDISACRKLTKCGLQRQLPNEHQ